MLSSPGSEHRFAGHAACSSVQLKCGVDELGHEGIGSKLVSMRCVLAKSILFVTLIVAGVKAAVDPVSYLTAQAQPPSQTVHEIWGSHKPLHNHADLLQAAGDTFPYLPKQFLPEYKSPCWRLETGGPLKCLPYFQILGVSKCGTTDLYHRLTFNPDMVDCGWKGPHFWDESPYPSRSKRANYDGSFPAYVSIFDKAAQAFEKRPSAITGEASSNTYTGVLTYCRGVSWPRRLNVTLAQLLRDANPWTRLVVLFRDPVDRYYSAYYYYRTRAMGKGTAREFHERAQADTTQWAACLKATGSERECLRQYIPQQLVKGLYAGFLPEWLEVWPRDQLLLLRTEDYKAAPQQHVEAVARFLGLPNMSDQLLHGATSMKKANVKSYEPMLPETRKLLQDFYRPYNQRLSELLGGDVRWLWGY